MANEVRCLLNIWFTLMILIFSSQMLFKNGLILVTVYVEKYP